MENQKPLLSWQTNTKKKDSNAVLYTVLVVLVAIAAAIYYFFQKEYFTSLVFIFLTLVLGWYSFTPTKPLAIAILKDGFKINNQFYKFDNFKGYWVSQKTGIFYFEPKGRIGSLVSIPIEPTKANEIKRYFPEELIETEDRGDDFSNRIADIFKI